MSLQEYPKLLWSADGVEVTCRSAEEESRYVAEGYRLTAEPPAELPLPDVLDDPDGVPPVDVENEPATFGPPDDPTYAEGEVVDDEQVEDAKPKKGAKKK